MKKVDEVILCEKKKDMKQWEVPLYAVLEQNIRSVKKVDEIILREQIRLEAMRGSFICSIRTKHSQREKGRRGTTAW